MRFKNNMIYIEKDNIAQIVLLEVHLNFLILRKITNLLVLPL